MRDQPQYLLEHLSWDGDLRHLEDDIASVAHHLRADLDQLLLQARQRPALDRLRCCKRAKKVAKIVGERMNLKPDRIGSERPARQSRPLDRALAFLDPLFARPALIVEGDDPVGRARQVGDDETDARIKLAGMPFDFGNHPARLGPASRLIGEIGMEPTDLVRWSSDWAREQVADPILQDSVGR